MFDCLGWQLQNFPLEDMLAAKENGLWRKYSTREVAEKVDQLSAALLGMGYSAGDGSIEGRDKIAIISLNCPEWMMTDMAIQQIGAVSVPIYPNINNSELEFILQDAGVKMIFCRGRKPVPQGQRDPGFSPRGETYLFFSGNIGNSSLE